MGTILTTTLVLSNSTVNSTHPNGVMKTSSSDIKDKTTTSKSTQNGNHTHQDSHLEESAHINICLNELFNRISIIDKILNFKILLYSNIYDLNKSLKIKRNLYLIYR